jgi:hypothetical protein
MAVQAGLGDEDLEGSIAHARIIAARKTPSSQRTDGRQPTEW